MALDITKEIGDLMKMYEEDQRNFSFNAIVYGDMGTGKTHLLRTCRRPIFIHSFDPGGTKTLRLDKGFMHGEIIVDTRFERENAKNPTTYELWEKEFDRLSKADFFKNVGTYVLDSATTWSDALMNAILKRNGRTAGTPQQMDWMVQMNTVRDAIKAMCALPCDCILTAHIDYSKDDATGRLLGQPLFTGKLKQKIPLLFDEIYVTQAKETSKGTEYSLLTQANSLYTARSRLGTGGTFERNEKPDIKALLKKAGIVRDDLPALQ